MLLPHTVSVEQELPKMVRMDKIRHQGLEMVVLAGKATGLMATMGELVALQPQHPQAKMEPSMAQAEAEAVDLDIAT